MLPKTTAYVKRYDEQTKSMYFWIENDDLLGKYNNIWDKVSSLISKNNSKIVIFEIKLVLISKTKLTAGLSIIIIF